MALDFTVSGVIDILSQTIFDGNVQLAGIAIMLCVFFAMIVILANLKAPVEYSLVPMMILSVFFSYIGVIDTTISFLVIIVSVVILAVTARKLTSGD